MLGFEAGLIYKGWGYFTGRTQTDFRGGVVGQVVDGVDGDGVGVVVVAFVVVVAVVVVVVVAVIVVAVGGGGSGCGCGFVEKG